MQIQSTVARNARFVKYIVTELVIWDVPVRDPYVLVNLFLLAKEEEKKNKHFRLLYLLILRVTKKKKRKPKK